MIISLSCLSSSSTSPSIILHHHHHSPLLLSSLSSPYGIYGWILCKLLETTNQKDMILLPTVCIRRLILSDCPSISPALKFTKQDAFTMHPNCPFSLGPSEIWLSQKNDGGMVDLKLPISSPTKNRQF